MDEKLRFRILVMLLAETYEIEDIALDGEVDRFVDLVSETGGELWPWFAKSNYDQIDFTADRPIEYKDFQFYAAYDNHSDYDSPTVCAWNKPIKELEELLKEASPTLYKEYIVRLTGTGGK